jgi:4-amino-4-deoxy-L-arabinose transferase-like glycosyltransferase
LNEPMFSRDRVSATAFAALFAALCIVAASLPALPVDETRYLTVAWEMRATGNWSLPTLNFAPYSHKPPLLFWLINANWSVFGAAVWPARMIGATAMAVVLVLTHLLEKRLAPDTPAGPAASALMLLGLPLFVALGFSIMFDMLLTATVSGAMLALWIAGRTGSRVAFAGYAISIGLGLLAKGPVGLLFTLPAALLASYWIEPAQKQRWALRIGLSLALGTAMALAWALRAAYLGGPEFAEMLFWKQSAGRITSSFAHARPIWFYLPILLLLFVPLMLWRPAVSALRTVLRENQPARNFLLAWILPAFIGLSLVSGKQLHYLLPLLPAVTLLASLGLRNIELRTSDRIPLFVFAIAILCALAACALGASRLLALEGCMVTIASKLNPLLPLLTGVLALAAIASAGQTLRGALTGLGLANLVVLTSLAAQSRETLAQLFDLQPLADVIAPLHDRPIAMTQDSRGEFGFLARLDHPIEEVPIKRLSCWVLDHPNGIAIVRDRRHTKPFDPTLWTVLAEKKYRLEETIWVIEAKATTAATPVDKTRVDRSACKP